MYVQREMNCYHKNCDTIDLLDQIYVIKIILQNFKLIKKKK